MNVLSLFDGMSCGRIALERAGISVTEYYASEIDKYGDEEFLEDIDTKLADEIERISKKLGDI